MSPEIKRTIEIDRYRKLVHKWVKQKPTLEHTSSSLMLIVYDEYDELTKATTKEDVLLELGDVLFALLALDDREEFQKLPNIQAGGTEVKINSIGSLIGKIGKDIRHFKVGKFPGYNLPKNDYMRIDNIYAQINCLCIYNQASLNNIFESTYRKNRIHYPNPFFDSRTPFMNPRDAIDCLRLFRSLYDSPDKLNKFWMKLDDSIESEMAFYDIWYVTQTFREYIKHTLEQIVEANRENKLGTIAATLIRNGYWEVNPIRFNDELIYQK